MSNEDKASKTAIVVSTGAAIAAGLAWLRSGKKVQAAPGENGAPFPDELMQLIIAIASDVQRMDLQNILDAINGISLNLQVQGWPPNVIGSRTVAVVCAQPSTSYNLSDMEIPDGMSLVIKAAPGNAIGSLIYVARTPAESTNPFSSWPLIPNEAISYLVKNAESYYVSTNVAGSVAIYTAEQRG